MFLKYISLRKITKRIGNVTKKFPLIHRFLAKIFNLYIIYCIPILNFHKKFKYYRKKDITKILGLQSINIIKSKNIDLTSRDNLIKSTKSIKVKEGGWCVYYKNAFDIIDQNLFLDSYKNKSIGLKILINNKNKNPKKSRNSYGLRPFGKYADVREILRVGNRLNLLNIGPKIYDLINLEDKNGLRSFAYLVENIEGKGKINNNELNYFFKRINSDPWLKPTWATTKLIDDFDLDKENTNFIKDVNGFTKFIDFQSFSIIDENAYINDIVKDFGSTSFGAKRIFSKENFLYQVLPEVQDGKRDTLTRWSEFDKIFKKIIFSLKGKTILDVGCNIGMNCYYALSRGAKFTYGIDTENISIKSKTLLNALGVTRSEIFGLDLNSNLDLNKINNLLVNNIDILFYCSIDGHIGYPNQIREIPFKYILHEGHPNTSIEENIDNLLKHNWLNKKSYKILYKNYIEDGDSPSRPLLFVSR